jgi:hypothetical protein
MNPIFSLLVFAAMVAATPRVLVYTATRGYRHDSIPTAIEVIGQQAGAWNVSFEFTEYVVIGSFSCYSATTIRWNIKRGRGECCSVRAC